MRRIILAVVLVLGGCAYPTRNDPVVQAGPATQTNAAAGHRYAAYIEAGGRHANKRLIILTMSGGGTRASALALGALRALKAVDVVGTGHSLAEEVDIVSSVSGGSVTAAYYALFGDAGQRQGEPYLFGLDRDFIRQDVITELIAKGANPVGLARLSTPSYERIDLLRDALARRLFHDADFRTLDQGRDRPFLIVNAADMAAGTVFPFSQDRFDLLCSRLDTVKIADAVSASAAFPALLSPVTLRNYAPCIEYWNSTGFDPRTSIITAMSMPTYEEPIRSRRAWEDWRYLNLEIPRDRETTPAEDPAWQVEKRKDRKDYVHLLDGGIADNLGLSEPIVMLGDPERLQSLPDLIANGDISSVVFVVVNARSEAASTIDGSQSTPGILSMLLATIDASIDAATAATLDKLPTIASAIIGPYAEDRNVKVSVVPVDFDYVENLSCRSKLKNIATSWTLKDSETRLIEGVGEGLVYDGLRRIQRDLDFKIVLPPSASSAMTACGGA